MYFHEVITITWLRNVIFVSSNTDLGQFGKFAEICGVLISHTIAIKSFISMCETCYKVKGNTWLCYKRKKINCAHGFMLSTTLHENPHVYTCVERTCIHICVYIIDEKHQHSRRKVSQRRARKSGYSRTFSICNAWKLIKFTAPFTANKSELIFILENRMIEWLISEDVALSEVLFMPRFWNLL